MQGQAITTIAVTKEEAEAAMPEWVRNDIPAVRELYHAQLDWRVEMFRAVDNLDAQNSIREFARTWDEARHTITLSEAQRRWNKTNLRQNAADKPHRWKADDPLGTWLTTTYCMEAAFGPEPTSE